MRLTFYIPNRCAIPTNSRGGFGGARDNRNRLRKRS